MPQSHFELLKVLQNTQLKYYLNGPRTTDTNLVYDLVRKMQLEQLVKYRVLIFI